MLVHRRLHRWPLRAERRKGAGAAAEHRDEQAERHLVQTLDLADHLVDPRRKLGAGGHPESRDQTLPRPPR
jgi:hypothetical protein